MPTPTSQLYHILHHNLIIVAPGVRCQVFPGTYCRFIFAGDVDPRTGGAVDPKLPIKGSVVAG